MYFTMKSNKTQWDPRIINIMSDGTRVDDLTGYIIPAGQQYYTVLRSITCQKLSVD
ncbi:MULTISPECIES: BOW99_gp33 family protein [Bacteria]|uniref:BOW99_gp33 family protein n=2 Tax=cellular organisms TaxID=131567 RepID=UPI0026AAC819